MAMMTNINKLFGVFVAAILMGCSIGDGGKTADKDQMERKAKDSLALKVGVSQCIDCLPAFVAMDEGIFDSLGVDVKLVHYTSQLDCDKSLGKKTLDGAFVDDKRIEYLVNHGRLSFEKVLSTGMEWKLVANRKSRVTKINQLSDKLVAMTRFSATDFLCDKMSDSIKGKKEEFFRMQVNDVDIRLKMLQNGEIDAAWLPEPQASVAKKGGGVVLMNSNSCSKDLSGLFFTSCVVSDKRKKQQIDTFVRAYKIAQERIAKQNAAGYSQMIRHYFKYSNVSK